MRANVQSMRPFARAEPRSFERFHKRTLIYLDLPDVRMYTLFIRDVCVCVHILRSEIQVFYQEGGSTQ